MDHPESVDHICHCEDLPDQAHPQDPECKTGTASNEYDRIVADAQTEAKKILDNADKNAALEEQKRIQQAQEQIAGLVVEATAKLVAAKQNADSDRELYNQFIAKTGEEID